MMTIPVAMQNSLDTGATALCSCWKISLTNNTFKYYTNATTPVDFGGNTYIEDSGFSCTAIRKTEGISPDNLDIEGFCDASFISEADLLAGVYDNAVIDIFVVDYKSPAPGTPPWFSGVISDIKIDRGKFTINCDGLSSKLSRAYGEVSSPDCRARLGDSRCQKNLSGFTMTGTVTAVTSRTVFAATLSGAPPAGWFDSGKILFNTGQNSGRTSEIKTVVNPSPYQFTLQLPTGFAIAIGNTFTATAGCDGAFTTCVNKFSNGINFVGEPHSPGVDKTIARGDL